MKILKKIGIGCLVLVICFCSCFKFVNAETIENSFYQPINEPFNLTPNKYVLFVDVNETAQGQLLAYGGINDETELKIYGLSDVWDGDLYIEIWVHGSEQQQLPLTYIKTIPATNFHNQFYVLTFEMPAVIYDYLPNLFNNFVFDDSGIAFITTYDYYENPNGDFSVYNTIYDLVEKYIFGEDIVTGSHQDLTATILSSIICILVFALPFLVVWKVIKVIMG